MLIIIFVIILLINLTKVVCMTLLASVSPTSSFSNMASAVIPLIHQYSTPSEIATFAKVNRFAYAESKLSEGSFPLASVNEAFKSLQSPLLRTSTTLTFNAPKWPNQSRFRTTEPLVECARVKHLKLDVIKKMPLQLHDDILSKLPGLVKLSINDRGEGDLMDQALSAATRANIANLTELDFSGSASHFSAMPAMLNDMRSLTSVKLDNQVMTDSAFIELSQNANLRQLNLQHSITVPQSVDPHFLLGNCNSLESFSPGRDISEDALISILVENPGLRILDLSECNELIFTDRLLEALETKTLKLEQLKLPVGTDYRPARIDEKFTALSLVLQSKASVPAAT